MSMQYELVVTGGSQVGAKALLRRNGKTTVGTDLSCDIVLGGGSDKCQLELQNDNSTEWSITLIEGEASYENTPCSIDKPVAVTLGRSITVGSTTIVIRGSGRIKNHSQGKPSELSQGNALSGKGVLGQAFWYDKRAKAPRSFLLFGVLGIVLATTGLAIVGASLSGEPVEEEAPSIRSLLDGSGFSRLEYSEDVAGGIVVTGFQNSWRERMDVQQLLSGRGVQVRIKTVIGKDLEDSVASVYRVHGISATAEATGAHDVIVRTSEADLKKLKGAEAAVENDIPGLILSTFNTPPPPKTVDNADKAVKNHVEDPGKKVIAIVVGDPSYVVTQDESRYYVGSVLSTGHKIKSINENLVQLDKAGVITTLGI